MSKPNAMSNAVTLVSAVVIMTCAMPVAHAQPQLDKAEQAAAISITAVARARAGDFKTCAMLFHQAWIMHPAERGYLYSAARCEQKAGQLDKAYINYGRYLESASAGDSLAAKAKKHRTEIEVARGDKTGAATTAAPQTATAPTSEPANKSPTTKPAAGVTGQSQPGPSRIGPSQLVPWSAVGGGTALAAVGLWLALGAADDIRALEGRLAKTTGAGDDEVIVGTTYEDAKADQDSANVRSAAGMAMMGVGAVAIGYGVWQLLQSESDQKVTLLPTLSGARLMVRF
ncbi:MAG: hypothetical protein KC502_05615 [Myxococcales bacterium]|nr:hypothetical protein [Myxococcales bacterium]